MRELFAGLVVSCPNEGGLFYLNGREIIKLDDLDTTGICHAGGRMLRGLQPDSVYAVENMESRDWGDNRIQVNDIHDVLMDVDFFYAVSTAQNEVVKFNRYGKEVQRYTFPGELDSWHINCLVRFNERVLFSAFGDYREHCAYKADPIGSGFVQDLYSGERLIVGLSQPHSLVRVGRNLMLANSYEGEICEYDGAFQLLRKSKFDGYVRGLLVDGDVIYVGLSASRNREDGSNQASLLALDLETLKTIGHISLPVREVYGLIKPNDTDLLVLLASNASLARHVYNYRHQENDRVLRAHLEQAQAQLASHEALLQTLREECAKKCVEHDHLTAEATDRIASLGSDLIKAQTHGEEWQTRHEIAVQKFESLESDLIKAQTQCGEWQTRHKVAVQKIESLESDLIKAQTRGEEWRIKYNQVLLSVDSLEARLKTALNDCALNFIAAQMLEKRETELNNKYDLIVKSHSWRVTRPLRFARRTITALLKGDIGPILNEIKFNHVFGPRITRMRSGVRQRIQRTAYSKQNIPALNDLLESRSLLSTYEIDALPSADYAIEFDLSIVTFNSSKWIDKYFNSLIDEGYPLKNIHVWIMDNGSTDDSLELLRNVSQSLGGRFATFNVAAGRNLGFGAGHHENFKRAKTDFVLVSNIDMEFVRGSLFKLTAHIKDDAAARFAAWEMAQAPYEHPKHYDPVSWVTNWQAYACVMIRKAAYQQVNGFDRRIFMYCEDVELSYRFRSFGWHLKYCPDCVVIHYSYESDGRLFKPLQFYHSVVGSGYVRMRFGTVRDRLAGLLQHIWLIFRTEQPLPKSRSVHVKNFFKLILNTPHFLVGKGKYKANYPFRGFDFEITRFGADHPVLPRPSSRAMISIITRTHSVPHRDELLRQAGISVGKQRHKNIEWIVVQDGGSELVSTVNEIADAFPHLKVKFIANSKLGRSCAGNAGLAAARGDYFMFLDDDDLIYADHCDVLSNHLDNDENLMAVYALAFEVPSLIGPGNINELDYITHPGHIQEWDYSVLSKYNFIPIQAIMFRRRLYDERGGFNASLDQLEDWNLWLRYGYRNTFKLVQKTTSLYRVPADQEKKVDRQRQLNDAYAEAKRDAEKWVESKFNNPGH